MYGHRERGCDYNNNDAIVGNCVYCNIHIRHLITYIKITCPRTQMLVIAMAT